MPKKVVAIQMGDSEKERKKTQKVFVDRDNAIEHFSNVLNEIKNEPDSTDIIYYWGVGGIGKSHLINHLFRETVNKSQTYEMIDAKEAILGEDQIRIRYNLDLSQNEIEILFDLRCKLIEEFNKRLSKPARFDLFDYTLLKYEEKSEKDHIQFDDSDKSRPSSIVNKLISDAGLLGDISSKFAPVAAAAAILALIGQTLSILKKRIQDQKMDDYNEFIDVIDHSNSDKILKRLHVAFALDVIRLENEIPKHEKYPIIIAIDTIERLFFDDPNNINNPEYDISWLFGSSDLNGTDGLIDLIPSVLWVLCGRDKLDDELLPSQYQFKLESLDASHIKEVIDAREINATEEVISSIVEVTEGVPAYLDICAELCIEKEDSVTTADFEGGIKNIVNRYMQLMTNTDKENLHLMTSLGQWIDDDFIDISNKLGGFREFQISYNNLIQKSFIQTEGESRRIFHNIVREALYSDKDYSEFSKAKNFETIVAFYASRISDSSLTEEDLLYYADRIMFLLSDIVDSKEKYLLIKPLAEDCSEKLETVNLQKSLTIYSTIDQNMQKYKLSKQDKISFENEYSAALIKSGLTEKAREYLDDLYRSRESSLGEGAPESLDALYNLGTIYMLVNRNDEAAILFEKILEKRKLIYEDSDLKRLDILSKLADSYYDYDLDKAKQCYEELYTKYSEALGENDINTKKAFKNLVGVYHGLGDDKTAQMLVEKAINNTDLNSSDLRNRCQALLFIGSLYEEIADVDAAADYYDKACSLCRDSFEDMDQMTLDSFNDLAMCYYRKDKFEQAYPILSELYNKHINLYDENDQRTIKVLERLANSCLKTKRYEEAKKHYEHLFRWDSTVLGTEHEDTYIAGLNLADSNYELGNYEEALDIYLNLLKIELDNYRFYGIETAYTSKQLVRKWIHFIQYEKGVEFYKEYFINVTDPKIFDISSTKRFRSVAYGMVFFRENKERINKCLEEYENIKKEYGPNHLKTLESLSNLANTYFISGRCDEGIESYKQLYRKVLFRISRSIK